MALVNTRIRQAAVLGAGVMGAQIAAHLANAGVAVRLLDVTPEAARDGLARARTLSPHPFFVPETAALITTGSFDGDLATLAAADWIVEAIVEQLEPKQALMARVDRVRHDESLVSSNTSGIPIAAIAEGRSDSFRAHWLGTHFFNPPRYLHLLELIPTPETRPDVVEMLRSFADLRLGKGVVTARDVPGFIANRIATYGVMDILRAVEAGEFTVEEIDAITGPAIGRPKSATFRTIDLAGVDVLAHVSRTLATRVEDPGERAHFALPRFVDEMVARGMTGAKAGKGFYQKAGDEIRVLDPVSLTYRSRQTPSLPSLERARRLEQPGERIAMLFNGGDRVGAFLRATLGPALDYADRLAPVVACDPGDVDRALRWGYGWDLGPIETRRVLKGGRPEPPAARRAAPIMRRNPGASLIDLGDEVVQIEFHSKMNTLGGDAIEMIRAGVDEAARNYRAIVVANGAAQFSAGANLLLLLLEAQGGNWDEVDLMVRAFQGATMALKYADVPVVVAPAGLTLGGGCEVVLHGARVQAAAESYIGLVETGVGLIPAGGGTKELLARAVDGLPQGADSLPHVQRVFETIGYAKVSTSAAEARRIGYLRECDAVTMNRDRLLADAKTAALALAAGYQAPIPRAAIPVGGESIRATLSLGVHLAWRAGRISDHDALIGRKLAWILSGGALPHAATLTEEQLLDLEREAFLSLCGERRTQERIAHTLKTGKPLRN